MAGDCCIAGFPPGLCRLGVMNLAFAISVVRPLTLQDSPRKRTFRIDRFVPLAAVSNRSKADNLFDHLVGAADQRQRNGKAEGLGSLQVDDQLDFGGLLDRQIGRLLALENLGGVATGQAV